MTSVETSAVVLGVVGETETQPRFIPDDEASEKSESEIDFSPLELQKPEFSNFKYITGQVAGFTSCDISKISETFNNESYLYKFKLLTHLNISGFKNLKSLPDIIFNLKNLEILVADDCNISSLVEINFHGSIKSVSLRNNQLATLPKLTNVNYLEKLDISYNMLDGFYSESISECYSLETLNLNNNEICEVDLSRLDDCLILKNLNFQYNQISNQSIIWPANPLPQVRNLNLANNRLTEIPEPIPEFLPGLFSLELQVGWQQKAFS